MLGGGAAAVVLAAWLLWPAAPASTPTPPRPRGGRPAAAAAAAAQEPLAPVKLEALTASRQEPGDASRNPFRYKPKAAPPPPKPVAPPVSLADPPKPASTVPAGPPPPPPIPLKFIGVLERANGVKWAVLSDGKVTLHGRDGDNIDGRYRIVKIGNESIEMTYLDGRGRQVIRLTGQ